MLRSNFPALAADATLHVGPAEERIKDLADGAYDLVFTMAVLEHIHSESEWLFGELCRITDRWLFVVEDEETPSWRHFPRNYGDVFGGHGMTQVSVVTLKAAVHGLGPAFRARLFQKS